MKIGMISSGSSIHVKKIANELIRRGHEITLYTLPNNDKLLSDFDKRIKIIRLPYKGKAGYFLNAAFIRNHIRNHPVDIVNSHYASGYGTLARLSKEHPLVLAVFGSDVFDFPFRSHLNMRIFRKNLNNANVITSTSQVMADKVKQIGNCHVPIYITPFGVNTDLFHPIDTTKQRDFVIGIIKKIETIYGYECLLHAAKVFMEKYNIEEFRIEIYGRGSKTNEYRNLAKKLGIAEKTHFNGFVPNEEIPRVLSQMNVVCLPSIVDESFGVAAIEAMACGIPVIASDAQGFTEVIEDEVTGFIVPKNDIESLADAIYKVYTMSNIERKMMSEASIMRVRTKYDFVANMDIYEKVLKKTIK